MTEWIVTHNSITDLIDAAEANVKAGKVAFSPYRSFSGVDTFDEAFALARTGWEDERVAVMNVVDHALESVDDMISRPSVYPMWDVSGSQVDVDAFLSGDPHNMIEWYPTESEGMAKVITIVVSISASGGVSAETKIAYGKLIASLIFALDRMGINVELYVEWGNESGSTTGSVRTLIKGANDELDAARVLYAVAHPSMHRVLCWSAALSAPHSIARSLRWTTGMYPTPIPPRENMGDHVTYMPMIEYGMDKERASAFITRYFRMLGIKTEA